VNINGTDLLQVTDGSFDLGAISFEAIGWGAEPPIVNFGNILVTTP
jgi:hypothetical protein